MPFSSSIQSLIKWAISLFAFGFIIWKIASFENLPAAWQLFTAQVSQANLIWILLVLAGIPIHWLFEILKWNNLIHKIYPLRFSKACLGVLSGLTMALVTPNRIGEVFTRVFVLPPDKRTEGIAYSGVNTLAQFVVIQFFGLLGLCLFLIHPDAGSQGLDFLNSWLIILSSFLALVLIFSFFNLKWVLYLSRVLKLSSKYPGIQMAITSLTSKDKWMTLLYSGAKYLTYTLQFLLLLWIFGLDLKFSFLLPALMTIYLLMNFIPVISVSEIGVRGSITLLILGQNPETDLGIVAASLLIWILNIALPALLGSYLLKRIKF